MREYFAIWVKVGFGCFKSFSIPIISLICNIFKWRSGGTMTKPQQSNYGGRISKNPEVLMFNHHQAISLANLHSFLSSLSFPSSFVQYGNKGKLITNMKYIYRTSSKLLLPYTMWLSVLFERISWKSANF